MLLTFFPQKGRVLVQFLRKNGSRSPLGFSGELENRTTLIIDRVYLPQDGSAILIDEGVCQFGESLASVSSAICGARIQRGNVRQAFFVEFRAR